MYPPGWGYDFTVPFCDLFDTLEICLSFPCLIISFLSYLCIVYLIFVAKNMKTSVQSRKNEIAILFQSAFVTIYISGMIFVWHPALFSMIHFIDMNDVTNQAILNCLWIIHCYVNPCMLLIFNKSIRADVFRFMRTQQIERAPSRSVMMSTVSMA
uniref:G_PROTEIN_RECEP_F1_2 domain-containing protein n=1 Tax=Caenorhabditis tropicalis TaxID=1561998 RepID=A0A1I7TYT0_9PELO